MSTQAEFDISNMTIESLAQLQPDQVIQLTLSLKAENDELKKSANETVAARYDERLEKIEREINLTKQYIRRDTIEIAGVPSSVPDENVEAEVIKILKLAKAKAGNKQAGPYDIQAAHRKNRKGTIICKFVNRKFAISAVKSGHNLKDAKYVPTEGGIDYVEPPEGYRIFINESLCPEFGYLHFAVRKAKKNYELFAFKVRNGVMSIQKTQNGQFEEISHVNDLERHGLTVPPRGY